MLRNVAQARSLLHGYNPYKAISGPDTDRTIHEQFFNGNGELLPFSTDEAAAEKLRSRLKAMFKHPVQVGKTKTHPIKFFARFDTGPSTSTEVLAETQPLAICRLALVIGSRRDSSLQ